MSDLLTVGLAGFAAAFVDGALGMGFGPTSSSILLTSGISPAGVSATVNIAKVATGLVSGVSHWRFGNIDRRLVIRLAVPGMVGAVVGTYILTNVDGDQLRPFLAILLILIGLRILLRFRMPIESATSAKVDPRADPRRRDRGCRRWRHERPDRCMGPGRDAVPPASPGHAAHRRRLGQHRRGSRVAFVAAGSLLTSASTGIDVGTVAAMLIGGVIAAPVAAWSVRFVPARVLGILVAGLLLLTNARELASWADLGASRWGIYGGVLALVVAAWISPRFETNSRRPASPRSEPVGTTR